MSYYDDGGEHEYGDDDGYTCGRCHCALGTVELAEAIEDTDGELVCADCQVEAGQEASCAKVGEPFSMDPTVWDY